MATEEALRLEEEDEDELETDQYLVFTVHEQEYGLQALRVKEITSVLEPTEVPQAPPYVEGILNHRGELVSVINFRRKYGFDTRDHDEDTRIIMVEKSGHRVGLLVDAVAEVIKIPGGSVQDLPESINTPLLEQYIDGVGILNDRLIVMLDIDKVLGKSDTAAMKEWIKGLDGMVKGDSAAAHTESAGPETGPEPDLEAETGPEPEPASVQEPEGERKPDHGSVEMEPQAGAGNASDE